MTALNNRIKIKTCVQGHQFYKSSDCPTCPICEAARKPQGNFLAALVAPARRALESQGITTLKQLASFTEKEILALHGMGNSTLPKLHAALHAEGLTFKNEMETMKKAYQTYNDALNHDEKSICDCLAQTIEEELREADHKIWHAHPVWFLSNNPTVGYSKQKDGIKLMFWSGADFEEAGLNIKGKKFKDAAILYKEVSEINTDDLRRWLKKSMTIQWNYKDLVKNKGKLEKLV